MKKKLLQTVAQDVLKLSVQVQVQLQAVVQIAVDVLLVKVLIQELKNAEQALHAVVLQVRKSVVVTEKHTLADAVLMQMELKHFLKEFVLPPPLHLVAVILIH